MAIAQLQATPKNPKPNSQASVEREVWERDKVCVNCKSEYALQLDHIIPPKFGGDWSAKNMRVLCRSCNQRWAIEVYGRKKMEEYLS